MALTPLLLFLGLYLVTSLVMGDFYKMPIAVAFVLSSVYAACLLRGMTVQERVEVFSVGAADQNILQMIWIFILAGAFAGSAEAMGAIDATVNLTLKLLPAEYLTAGLFLAACFVSISVGTSVGTIVALTPVASGLAVETGMNDALLVAAVVGGSFFGDNLSFISDTTIAATRTQGCSLKDKFRFNLRIAAPAAVLTLVLYLLTGTRAESVAVVETVEWLKVVPYLLVLVTALAGLNVMLVLLLGIVTTGLIGLTTGSLDLFAWCGELGKGMVEVLKQGRGSPIKTELQIAIIYAVVNNMLSDIALSDISHFESELFDYLTATKDELLSRIIKTGVLSKEDEEELRSAINTVKKKFNTEER